MIFILVFFLLVAGAELIVSYRQRKEFSYIQHEFPKKSSELIKFKHNYLLMYDWFLIERKGISIATYFNTCPYKHMAIYGYDLIGELLKKELDEAGIPVEYVIAENDVENRTDIRIYTYLDNLPPVDLVVVTTNELYKVKEKIYKSDPKCAVVMLKDIVSMLLWDN